MLPMLQIGPFNLQTGGLVLILSAYLGISVTEWVNKKKPESGLIVDMLVWAIAGGIVIARLGYAIESPDFLFQNPLSILSLNTYQFDLPSGIAGFFLTMGIFSYSKSFHYLEILDLLTPFFMLISAGFYTSTFLTGEIYGVPATIPWAVTLWGVNRHPVQLYDLIFINLSATIIFKQARFKVYSPFKGSRFLLLVIFLSMGQIITLPFRGDPAIQLVSGFRIQQILAWCILGVSLFVFGKKGFPVE